MVTRIQGMTNCPTSAWLLNKFSLCQPQKSLEESMKNMHTDIKCEGPDKTGTKVWATCVTLGLCKQRKPFMEC